MDSQVIRFADDDRKAHEWIRENLYVCAHGHSLSRKLLGRFHAAGGKMIAFAGKWVDASKLSAYRYSLPVPSDVLPYAPGESPKDRLKAFVAEYLQSHAEAMVVCENSGNIKKTPDYWSWGTMPPISCYGDEEVYHVLTGAVADPNIIDSVISDTMGHWGTGVCAVGVKAKAGEWVDEYFLDEVVEKTQHIFMPVFDDDGILIWTPQRVGHHPSAGTAT